MFVALLYSLSIQATVNKIEVNHIFRLISDDFSAKSAENSLKGLLGFFLMFINTDKLSINITMQS